jgi:tetratricopeptide (TPR) repeat protein
VVRRRATTADAASFAAGLAAGAAPWLAFNAAQPFATFLDPGHQGWPLAEHLASVGRWTGFRARLWLDMADGVDALFRAAGPRLEWLALPVAAEAVLGGILAYVLAAKGPRTRLRPAAYWLGLAVLIFAFACLSPVPVKGHHLYAAYPFGLLALVSLAASATEGRLLARSSARLAAAALVCAQAAALAGAWSSLRSTGGSSFFYRGTADMASWLQSNAGGAPVYAMRRLTGPLLIESGGAVDAREVEDADPSRQPGRFAFLLRPGTLVVWRQAPFLYPDEEEGVPSKAARLLGARLERAAEFPYSDGRTWAIIERVAEAAENGDPTTTDEHLELGNRLYFQRRFAAAEAEFEAASKGDPFDPSPWISLGAARSARGDAEGALEALDKAVPLAARRGGRILDDALAARAELETAHGRSSGREGPASGL